MSLICFVTGDFFYPASATPGKLQSYLVKQKDGTDKFVVDFRRLDYSVHASIRIPSHALKEALDALNGTYFSFSTMDFMTWLLASGRWTLILVNRLLGHNLWWSLRIIGPPVRTLSNAPSTYQ